MWLCGAHHPLRTGPLEMRHIRSGLNVDLYFSRTSVFAIVLRQALADFRHSAAHHVVVRSVVIRATPEHFDPDRALFEFGLTAAEGPLDHIPQYGRVAFAVSQNRVGKDF